jgi:hypothetical protein
VCSASSPEASDHFAESLDVPVPIKAHSLMSCPVVWQGRVCGVLQFVNHVKQSKQRGFDDVDQVKCSPLLLDLIGGACVWNN